MASVGLLISDLCAEVLVAPLLPARALLEQVWDTLVSARAARSPTSTKQLACDYALTSHPAGLVDEGFCTALDFRQSHGEARCYCAKDKHLLVPWPEYADGGRSRIVHRVLRTQISAS